jgi:hypothetical protein
MLMPSVMLRVFYAECRYAECRGAHCIYMQLTKMLQG